MNKLKLKRLENDLTQSSLASISGISRNKIIEIEKGNYQNIKLKDMRLLADVLNSSIKELFLGDD